jgi:hypothetical protein
MWVAIFVCRKEKKMYVINRPRENDLVKLYRIEFSKDYNMAVKNNLEITDATVRAILGYKEPERKKIFGIF